MRLPRSVASPCSTSVGWSALSSRSAVQPGYWQWPPVRSERAQLGVGGAASDASARGRDLELERERRRRMRVARRLRADRPAFEQRRLIVAEVHDQRRGAAARHRSRHRPPAERDERVRDGLLPLEDRALLLVGGTLELARLRMACRSRRLLTAAVRSRRAASPVPPGHTHPRRHQRLVVGDLRRRSHAPQAGSRWALCRPRRARSRLARGVAIGAGAAT